MQEAIDQFLANLNNVRHLHSLHAFLSRQVTPVIDLSDILRAELVLAVSAWDHFVHQVCRIGVQEIYEGKRARTEQFLRFKVSIGGVLSGHSDWLDDEVRKHHGWRTFQSSEAVADALRLIAGESIWPRLGLRAGKPDRTLRDRLDLIVQRRNKIAHEADLDPTMPNTKWLIDAAMVRDAVDFIEQLGRWSHDELKLT